MELKEFVKQSLLDVIEGVYEAQQSIIEKDINAVINISEDQKLGYIKANHVSGTKIQDIEINASVSSTLVKNGKIDIKVLGAGGSCENKNHSTIKFKVPVLFPPMKIKGD